MSARVRPEGCCSNPIEPVTLATAEEDRLVGGFRALGDPTRFAIFRLIAAQIEPLCACDVVERFDLSQPTISHHLRVLGDAGLIRVERRGVWAYYRAEPWGAAVVIEAVEQGSSLQLVKTA